MNAPTLDIGTITEPLLVFGGPYSNLAATQAMRARAEQLAIPPERVICTGDLIAYCARPQETADLVRDWGIHLVMGNCEESLARSAPDCGCGFEPGTACSALSAEWYNYATLHIDGDTRSWFATLPRALRLNFRRRSFQVVHGTPTQTNRFVFASTSRKEKRRELERITCDGLIAGHCGIPFGEKIDDRVWLNAGVIGMPANDGTPDGWYMILDHTDDRCHCQWHRLYYPTEQTAAEMQAAGLRCGYADTITTGLWPSEDVLPAQEKEQRGQPLQPAPVYF